MTWYEDTANLITAETWEDHLWANLPDGSRSPLGGGGIRMLVEQLLLVLQSRTPPTSRAPVTIDVSLDDNAPEAAGLTINANLDNEANPGPDDYSRDAVALRVNGRFIHNGLEVVGVPVGAVVFWPGAVNNVPNGWAIMDGIENSAANGGSGINAIGASGAYLKLKGTADASINAATNTGSTAAAGKTDTGSASIGSTGSGSANISSPSLTGGNTTGATITGATAEDNANLSGTTGGSTVTITGNTEYAAVPAVQQVVSNSTTDVGVCNYNNAQVDGSSHRHGVGTLAGDSHSHGVGSISDSGHTHSAGTLALSESDHDHSIGAISDSGHTHSVSDSGHTHGFTGDGHDHTPGEPANIGFIPIEFVGFANLGV